MQPLICPLPYPRYDKIQKDTIAARVLMFAYKGQKGEWNTVKELMQNVGKYHTLLSEDAATVAKMAWADILHATLLKKYIICFGGGAYCRNITDPVAEKNQYKNNTAGNVLVQCLMQKLTAICEYKKMLAVLKNSIAKELIQRIILDEQLHLEMLQRMLCRCKKDNSTV